jgi:uncharacterized protein DUF6600
MKRLLLALTIAMALLPIAPQTRADTEVSIDYFYDNLNDGNWIEVGDYGYCWQPNVAVSNAEWRPYADGYWAYTDVGWTWVSNENFGWATYHYGRWARLEDEGWVWVPGYEWGPAWVSWRTGGDYVGWAPLPPTRERVYEGRAITGHVDVEFDIGPTYYNFVDVRYIGEPVLRERIVPTTQNVTVISNTVNVTNISYNNSVVYNYGPDYNRVSQYSVRPIQRLTIQRETGANLTTGVTTQNVTKVEGQNLLIAAPQRIQRAAKTVAPKNVKAKVAQAKIERGWAGISDPKVKTQLVQKMKAEDSKNVPPPSVSPSQNASGLGASPATAASPAISGSAATPVRRTAPLPTATPAHTTPAATAAMTTEKGKEKGNREIPAPSPSITPTTAGEQEQATPPPKGGGGRQGRRPSEHPSMTPSVGEPKGMDTEADQSQRMPWIKTPLREWLQKSNRPATRRTKDAMSLPNRVHLQQSMARVANRGQMNWRRRASRPTRKCIKEGGISRRRTSKASPLAAKQRKRPATRNRAGKLRLLPRRNKQIEAQTFAPSDKSGAALF